MGTKTIEWTKGIREKFMKDVGRVLDVGSLDVNGSVRHLFPDAEEYVGIDMRGGKNVDVVMNAHGILAKFGKGSFGTVLCYNMLEHDGRFWVTLENMRGVLKVGGWMVVVAPTYGFPAHDHPEDYWRFGESAYRDVLFRGFEVLDLARIFTKEAGGRGINPVLACLGRKRHG